MSNFFIFLTYTVLHVPVAILEHNSGQISAPVVIVIEDAAMYPYAPVVAFNALKRDGFYFEVEYITPVGKIPFKTVTTNKHFDYVYGASCFVRVRQTNGVFHGKWSKLQFVNQIVQPTTQATIF